MLQARSKDLARQLILVGSRLSQLIAVCSHIIIRIVVVVIIIPFELIRTGVCPLDEVHESFGLNIFEGSNFVYGFAHAAVNHTIERFGKTGDKVGVYV